ncbi:unnamed protein product [Bubo scandiacus]
MAEESSSGQQRGHAALEPGPAPALQTHQSGGRRQRGPCWTPPRGLSSGSQMNETGSRKKPSPNGSTNTSSRYGEAPATAAPQPRPARHVNDLYEDLRDGHNLISLLEVLSGDTLPREKGRMRFHKLQNVQIALNYLKHRQVKLVNIRNDDIADGNPKLTLGLIWTIILHFQISDIQVTGQSEDMTAKEKLLLWSQRMVEDYQGLRCDNFTTSWRDGRLFNAIIHRHKPMLIDMNRVYRQSNLENLDQAFTVAERDLGVTRLLDPEDVDVPQPDEKSIITYVSSLYDAMPRVPEVQDGVKANELQLRWQDYEEIEILWRQFLKFKETELPAKEADKNRSKGIFQSLEGAVQSGQLKVPPGYHPLDVEKEWGKLHVAVLEREKLLRAEFERLERLQRIVTKLQMESGLCEEQLNQADTLLQADVRLLTAGKAPQKAAEVERDLDKADAMIRLLFNDVQTLKDGRHPQGEQMYRRVYRLHERLVAIRTEYNLRLKSGAPAAAWGMDLPTIESHLGGHRGLHHSIEEFRTKIERARADEAQLSPGPRNAYRECLGKLDLQYGKLLNSSKSRLRHLESLHGFVSAATKELMWLNEKEEEEVTFDWSDRNPNMAAKKENYSGLMRELELRERRIKELQGSGERLLRDEHPGRQTLEAFLAALQTQWSWMLQLCCCIEAHLKENSAYFQFFADVKEAEEFLRKTQENMKKKYSCDRSVTVTRLEDLLQDCMEQKEQLADYGGQLGGLSRRAKAIVQLKPRSPGAPLQGRPPVQAVCDYKQMEITVHKGDTCSLLSNAQPHKWRVAGAGGGEAVVPSVCFLLPPPNKEALDAVHRLEAAHQHLLGLWHQLHLDLRSLLAWQYLTRDIQQIQAWSHLTFRTLPAEECRQVLRSLETHYQEFLRDSQDAQSFQPDDRLQVEREYNACTQKYELLLRSQEKGEQDESLCRSYISQLKDIRLQLEGCETRTVHKIRLPLDKDPLQECAQRIAEQQQIHLELEGIRKNLDKVSEKTEEVLAQPEPASSAPVLRSELEITLQKMERVYSLSSIYLEKLKTINLVIRSTQGAEELVKKYEDQLKDVQTVPADLKELEASKAELKRLRAQAEGHQPFFSTLETDLSKAKDVNERMVRGHSERDVDLDRYRERVQQLLERWQAVLAQSDLRQRELDQLGRQLRYYRESCDGLLHWIQDAKQRQERIQAVPITDSKTVREQLLQEKKLLEECDRNKEKVEECQRYAKQYIDAIKDYELQLVSFKAQVEPMASPAKKPKVQSASDSIIQEYVDLRTRYSELTTLTSQYIKFITETLRRLEEEEKAAEKLKEEERKRLAEVEAQLEKQRQLAEAHAKAKAQAEAEARELQLRMQEEVTRREVVAVDAEQQKQNIQQELMQLRQNSDHQIKSKVKLIEEAEYNRKKRQKRQAQEEAERLRRQVKEESQKKREAEEELKRKQLEAERSREEAEKELERWRQKANEALRLRLQAEEQRLLLEEELFRLKKEVSEAIQKRKEVEEELAKLRAEMEILLESKAKTEEESRSTSEKSKQRLEAEASKLRELAEEAARLRALSEEAKRQRQLAEEEAGRQRAEAERILKEKLAAINEASRLKAEAEIALKEKEAENERLRRLAEDEAYQRKLLEEQAAQHKQDIEEKIALLKRSSESELERQKGLLAREAAQKRIAAEEKAHLAAVQQKEQELLQTRQQEQSLLDRLREEAERARRAAEEAEFARSKAEQDASLSRQRVEEAERLKQRAEEEAQAKAQAQADAEKLRKEAELEMEELAKLKSRIEEENKALILKDKDNTQKFLAEEAEKMKQVAEEVARLSVEAQEAARMRKLAEDDLAQQRVLAEKMLKEKMQAVQEATRLKAEAEVLQKQKDLAQEHAKRLQEDKEQMQQRLAEETEGFQKTLEAERRRQLEITAEAERLKLHVAEMSMAQAKAEEEAKRFKKQAEEISERLHETELATREKMTLVHTLEIQRHQSDQDAEKLRRAIADLEQEKEKLKQEAALLQQKAEEMQVAQQAQLRQETQLLQQTFLTEKDVLLQKEKFIEEEKTKLEKLFKDEVNKAQNLKAEQERQQKEMEQEKQQLKAMLDEAQKHQKEAEENVRHKQEELQQLERQRQQQEKLLEEENKKLRERLEQMQEEYKAALAQTREIMIQTDDLPEEAAVTAAQLLESKAVPNGRDAVDGLAQNGEPEFAFEGIRQKVSAEKLADAGILSKESFEKLAKGVVSVGELSQREDIKKYLQGKSSIAGLLIKPSNQKMSIYEAMKKQLLSPGTALVLLEAQAASGFIIDPVRNARLSVNEAVREGVIGPELHNKMLSAERAVTGYKDPYTGDKISLFQAMTKELIVREHGIRLLEAQIATGGIIDPVHSHRLPVEVAYQRGYFDQEMNQVLSDPSDDTKGFFDPNTHENLTYMQLMERCVTDPDTGLCLLPLTDQAAKARELVYTDKEAKDVFKKATVTAPFGKFQGKTVTIWEIINSEYFTEDQRRDLIQQYRTGKITVEKIIKIIITVVEESEKKSQMCFEGLRAPVPAAELLESKIINKDLYNQLHQGKRSVKEVAEMESVRQYLRGTDAIAGVLVESTGQKLTFYDALKRNLLKPEIALSLLEAQAATGYILDPVRNKLLSVDEAVKAEVVGPEFHEKLLSAEKAVTGYKDPYTGQTVSLFQALKKGLIPSDTGVRLLDVQLATGGIIDPVNSHRLPLEVAYKRGYLDPEIKEALAELRDDAKAFYCPNTQEHLSYTQLQKSCHRDKQTGFCLLPLSDRAIQAQQEEVYTDSQAKECFDKATVEVPVGSLRGQTMTIWELIHSEYFTEEHRRELLRQYKTGKVTIEKIIKIVITIIEEAETKKQEKLTFSGLRAPVPASELVESRVISKAQYEQLKEGKKSVKDLSETDAVRRFLHGGDCIAGVYVEATKEKLNIYEAMKRNLLRPSTAVVLLEAQAATGFLIDAVKNRKLYVNEAVKAGVVGPELHEKLLSAEKAVTGYKDPYSGNTISLFQAMKKGLIVKEHGIRLLEAQIATGGIIDPVHSHRLPVEVAYQRGYFDQEMNQVLSDPSDDTKGFFDPNTHENLTYLQLKEKCIEDPETGLYLLPLREPEKPTVVETTQVYTEAETRKVFEETQVDIPVGSRAGSSMSLWEIMHSDLLPEEQRKQLMEEFQSGRVSKERMIIIIIEIIEKTEIIRQQNLTSYDYVRRRITAEDLYEAKIISLDIYNLLKQGSKTFRELLDVETVWKYLYGSGCVAGIYIPSSKQKLSIYQALKKGLISSEVARSLLEAQAATGFMIDPAKNEMLTVDEAVRKGVVGPEIHDRLLSAERAVTGYRDPYSEQKISIFQAMKKDLIPSEEALKLLDAQIATGGVIDPHLGFHLPLEVATQRGFINKDTYDMLSEPSEVRSYMDPSTEEKLSYTQLLKRCRKDEKSGLLLLPLCDTRKLTFRGLRKQITVEELVRSQVMDEATAQRLQEGLTSIEEVSKNLKKFLEGTSCIAGVFVDSTKERLSVYQAMKKGIIRPGTAFELLEAQAATGYVIDPIKGLKLTVEEAVRMGIVGPEFKDKLLSAERAVTGYRDPYSGKLISLFQAMKKGLILKDHGIRLLEAQIATGGIIDPEESHRLPVEIAYKRGLFDEEMNEILLDPSDDTKGFFDPNTEENLTYLQLMERCITDPETGLCLLPLKEKKRERKTSSKSSVRKRRVVIVDPETGKEMSVYEAYRKGLIDHQTYLELSEQECEWEEITTSSSDGVVKSMIIDRRSGRQYDIDDAIGKGLIDQSALDQYRSGTLSITEFADMLSGNMSGFRSRSSSVGSSSSYTVSPAPTRTQISVWSDPTEETGPVAGILDTDTLEKVSITEAMRRNLVDNITGQRLLEAQACTGGIIDPNTGDKCSVADAVNKGLVDKIMVDRINLAQKAFYGFEDPRTKTKMSAAQALKKGWLYYEAGQRFLEVQYLTGGLIEPEVEGRVSLDEALQKGTIDTRTAQKLRDVNTYSKYLTCPKTKLKISYKDAMDRSMIEDGTGLRLLEASSQSSKGYYSPYNVSSAGSTSGSRSGSRTGSRSGSRRGSFDATGSGFSMTFSSSSYSSSSFGRRYAAGPPSTAAALASSLLSGSCGLEASGESPGLHGPPPLRVA